MAKDSFVGYVYGVSVDAYACVDSIEASSFFLTPNVYFLLCDLGLFFR